MFTQIVEMSCINFTNFCVENIPSSLAYFNNIQGWFRNFFSEGLHH